VSAEFESENPTVIERGTSQQLEYVVPNAGLVPVYAYVTRRARASMSTPARRRRQSGRVASTTVTLTAPDETGHYRLFVVEHRYLAVLPSGVIDELYEVHPWAPLVAINGLLGGGIVGIGLLLLRGEPARIRSGNRAPNRRCTAASSARSTGDRMSQTPPSETRLRLRAVLNAQFTVILAVCLVAAAVGGRARLHDPRRSGDRDRIADCLVADRRVGVRSFSAEVTEPNSVFDTGTVLDGRNTYFTRVAPVLDVDVETSYAADAASDIDISFESVLVTQNVGSDDGTVYWDERETLTTETVSGVEPGETATASFALNSSEVDATASEIESDLGASPGETETFVTTAVTVEGTINGESTSYARTIEMTLDHGGDTYTVSEPGLNRTRRNRPSRSPSSRATDLSVLRADRCCSWRGLLGLAGWRTPAARSISRSRRPSGSTSRTGTTAPSSRVDHRDPTPRVGPQPS